MSRSTSYRRLEVLRCGYGVVTVRLWGISARGREGWVRAALPGQRRVKSKAEPKQRTLLEIEPWLALSQQLFAHRGL